jgi:hypothetical protein
LAGVGGPADDPAVVQVACGYFVVAARLGISL